MKIVDLKLKNYRCYSETSWEFNSNQIVLFGPNASGKTSILEAIFLLGITKSYRNVQDIDLIKFHEDCFCVKSTVLLHNLKEEITIFAHSKGKKVKRNNYTYKSLSEYLGTVNVVVFSSIDFLLFTGTPKDRRTFIDLIIWQTSKDYLRASSNYKRILKERNTLLKRLILENNSNLQKLLDVITGQLIEEGKQIIVYRKEFINFLNKLILKKHHLIASENEALQIKYSFNVDVQEYDKQMANTRQEDLKRGTTTIGPHKDDYIFIINNKNIALFSSQGQQRNALISIKLAVVDLLFEIKKEYPILLLDDVFSELDKTRQNQLIASLNKDVQTFITTATLSDVNESLLKDALVIDLGKRSV